MRYRLAIFDFDGTLADSAEWFARQLPSLALAHGFRSPSAEDILMLRRLPTREVVRALGVRPWKLPAIASDLRRRMRADAGSIRLFTGAPEMLQVLRDAGVRTAIVSSNSEDNVRRVLGASADLIDRYDCGAALFGKTMTFKRVMKALKTPATETCGIGDETRDIEAARAAGISPVAVTWGYASADVLRAAWPDCLVHQPSDLARLFFIQRSRSL